MCPVLSGVGMGSPNVLHPDGVQHHPSVSWSQNSEIREKTDIKTQKKGKSVYVRGEKKKERPNSTNCYYYQMSRKQPK